MSTTKDPKTGGDIVDFLLDPDRLPLGALQFTKPQIQRLSKTLASGEGVDPEVLARVTHHLARVRPTEETAALIADVLGRSTSPVLRRAAIAALGTLSGPSADKALAFALKSAPPTEEANILTAMAGGGGEASLAAIKGLPAVEGTRRTQGRAHAETVISYRLGKTPSAAAERLAAPGAVDLSVKKETAKRVKETLGKLDGTPYGLTFRDDIGFSFECAGTSHFVLINALHKKGAMLKSATAGRSIAAIVMREEREYGRFVPWRIVLLRPEKRGIRVSVTSTQGNVAMVGTLIADGESGTLSIRDVNETRPLHIAGTVSDRDISLGAEIFMAVPRSARQGQLIKAGSRL